MIGEFTTVAYTTTCDYCGSIIDEYRTHDDALLGHDRYPTWAGRGNAEADHDAYRFRIKDKEVLICARCICNFVAEKLLNDMSNKECSND